MGQKDGPLMIRRQLGKKLRSLREAADKTQEDVVEARIMSETTLWRIESGKTTVKQGDILSLARLYECTSAVTDALVAMGEGTRAPGWWEEYNDAIPKSLGVYGGLEASASLISTYHPELVHGLVQTEEYARAAIAADERLTHRVIEQRVAFRLERQRLVLGGEDPTSLDVILGAGALSLIVGSADVMEAQIAHLREIDAKEHVSIRVLPWTAGAHASMKGAFALLDFDDPDDPSTIYIETPVGARYSEQKEHVAEQRRSFGTLRSKSVPIKEFLK